jgi:hypothetical protein
MDAVKVITVITLGGATLFALSARPRIPDAIGSRDDLSPSDAYDRFYAESGLPRERVLDLLLCSIR